MIDTEYEQQMLQIEAILEEADRVGLRWEVQQTAESLLAENPDMDIVVAYEVAFRDWDII